jgi:peroxiredoxin
MKKYYKIFSFLFIIIVMFLYQSALSQKNDIKPVTLMGQMPDFTIPIYGGGELKMADLKGKNVLLIFLRGLAAENHWCNICNYQYAELADLEKTQQIRKKYNMEVFFVLPYKVEMINEWADKFPELLADIEKWKYPAEPEKQNERQKKWTETAKKLFPKKFDVKKGELAFPVLIDSARTLSKGLGIFANEWSGSKIDQNIPTTFIIDKDGIVQFKYISQSTLDRPRYEYIFKFIEKMLQ